MDPRRATDASDAAFRKVDRIVGRPARALTRLSMWLYVIAPAVGGGLIAVIILVLCALTLAPPMALMIVPAVACSVAWVQYARAELAALRAIDRHAPPGTPHAQNAAAAAPHVAEVELRRLRADDTSLSAFIALPVTFLLCAPWDLVYLAWAVGLAPFALFAWWLVRLRRLDHARVVRDDEARSLHPEVFAHPERVQDLDPRTTDRRNEPTVDLPVLLGRPLISAPTFQDAELARANALVCHERGVYLVEATLPTGPLRRSSAEPNHDRRAVLALASSGELWRPERIKLSSSWQDIACWSLTEREVTFWSHDGAQVRWQHRGSSDASRVGREAGAQLVAVTDELQRRLGPPVDR